MDLELVKSKLAERASDGQILCKDALAVAEELGIQPTGFAKILTEMDIKIVQCQLSCFP